MDGPRNMKANKFSLESWTKFTYVPCIFPAINTKLQTFYQAKPLQNKVSRHLTLSLNLVLNSLKQSRFNFNRVQSLR